MTEPTLELIGLTALVAIIVGVCLAGLNAVRKKWAKPKVDYDKDPIPF